MLRRISEERFTCWVPATFRDPISARRYASACVFLTKGHIIQDHHRSSFIGQPASQPASQPATFCRFGSPANGNGGFQRLYSSDVYDPIHFAFQAPNSQASNPLGPGRTPNCTGAPASAANPFSARRYASAYVFLTNGFTLSASHDVDSNRVHVNEQSS